LRGELTLAKTHAVGPAAPERSVSMTDIVSSDTEPESLTVPAAASTAASAPALSAPVHARRATADVLVQVMGRLLNLMLGVVATAVLARKLGSAGFGEWSTILLIPGLLAYLNNLGFLQVAVRRAAAEQDPHWLGALVSIRAALSVPTTLLSILAIAFVARGGDMLVAGIIVAAQGLLAGAAALTSVFQLQIRNDLPILVMTANSVLWTAAVVLIAGSGGDLTAYAVALVAIATLTTCFEALIALRRVSVPIRGTSRLWRELVRTAVPVSIGGLLIVAYARLDGLIVYTMSGSVAAGLYGAVCRIVEQAGFVPLSLVVTLMPIVSRLYPSQPKDVQRLLQFTLDLLAMFSLPALGFTLVASRPLIELLYGSHFVDATSALSILMGAFVLICCGYALGVFTLVLNLQSQFARYALGALFLNLALNLVFVPPYGFVAAAWITLVTEAFIMALTGRAVLRRLEMSLQFGRVSRVALAAAISAGVTLGLREVGVEVLLLLLAASLTHVAGLFALRALRPAELRAVLRRDPMNAF
jgi:O-antigen/teichoic acid export membrane protein